MEPPVPANVATNTYDRFSLAYLALGIQRPSVQNIAQKRLLPEQPSNGIQDKPRVAENVIYAVYIRGACKCQCS